MDYAIFLPTPSARRATAFLWQDTHIQEFLPTPSARRATFPFEVSSWAEIPFLPTPSARRATHPVSGGRAAQGISTHALREEGDANSLNHLCKYVDFYPRPPRGGRPSVVSLIICSTDFYPRPPRGGRPLSSSSQISAPRNFYPRPPRGGRHRGNDKYHLRSHFYPRPPRGGRR